MSYHVGNARVRASAANIAYEGWEPFEVLNCELVEAVVEPEFFRLRHIAILDIQLKVLIGLTRPDSVLVRLPHSITSVLPARSQQAAVSCARYGRNNPSERWISAGTATVDPRREGELPHYVQVKCETGFLQEHKYDIFIQMTIELV